MKHIKLIIRDGIVENALAEIGGEPVEVEVLDINRDYADMEWIAAYADELYADSHYQEVPYTVAHDPEEIHRCPVCNKIIDDEIDTSEAEDDGYGTLKAYINCPHCGSELTAEYSGSGYDFTGFTV